MQLNDFSCLTQSPYKDYSFIKLLAHMISTSTIFQYKNKAEPYQTMCDDTKGLAGFPKYTSEGCIYECLSNTTLKECGCRLPGEPGKPRFVIR